VCSSDLEVWRSEENPEVAGGGDKVGVAGEGLVDDAVLTNCDVTESFATGAVVAEEDERVTGAIGRLGNAGHGQGDGVVGAAVVGDDRGTDDMILTIRCLDDCRWGKDKQEQAENRGKSGDSLLQFGPPSGGGAHNKLCYVFLSVLRAMMYGRSPKT